MRLSVVAAVLLLAARGTPAIAQTLPLRIIDLFGAQRVSESAIRNALGFKLGDTLRPDSSTTRRVAAAEARLAKLAGVSAAKLNFVCCEAGGWMMYVGIAESGAPTIAFRPAPTGSLRLPAEIVRARDSLGTAMSAAIQRGANGETDTLGYALFDDTASQRIQRSFVPWVAAHLKLTRNVLRNSSSSTDRALAAELLGYAPKSEQQMDDLAYAMHDANSDVRNAAIRALWLLARYAQTHPQLGLRINGEPLIDLLWSIVWTDRNKSSMALAALTENRDSTLLSAIRRHALEPLLEMSRWTVIGHAYAGLILLGRVNGMPEAELQRAIATDDRDRIRRYRR